MRIIPFVAIIIFIVGCNHPTAIDRTSNFPKQIEILKKVPEKQNVWVFIMAGQSNMAGRGIIEPGDTLPNDRVLSINKEGELIIAKEPLHWYEPDRTGLDCGHSFGNTIIKDAPGNISVLLIPTAIGGSAISQWIGDSLYRGVKLLSNFQSKVELAKTYGNIKAILWHQGESDANNKDIPFYKERLAILFSLFRSAAGDTSLPVLMGELGNFPKNKEHFSLINNAIHDYSSGDKNSIVIPTADLKDRGDSLHFNSEGQRMMGQRFAEAYIKNFK
jgi:hypothetical protein